ncbi:MAG: hypothetical protein LBU37_07775, partial [Tannerellaceae bacterium]|nr:hypothetical protein [Tannerellaceae bacterium]
HINEKIYETGRKASEKFMQKMPVIFDDFLPKWNYKFDCNQPNYYKLFILYSLGLSFLFFEREGYSRLIWIRQGGPLPGAKHFRQAFACRRKK